MTVVAVAGGTGDVGRTIVHELVASADFDVIVLARKIPKKDDIPCPVIPVDYDDIEQAASLLARQNVVTVISTIQVMTEKASVAQINLIKAADKSGTVKRFVASEWTVLHTEISPAYEIRETAAVELRKTKLEWTRFVNGYFMDYYGMPHVKSHLTPVSFAVDVANKTAGIPGTGEELVSFTYTRDLAKFVVAALRLPRWEETTYCYGDKATFNQLVALAEQARGVTFDITYDPIDKLKRDEITDLPSHKERYALTPRAEFQRLSAVFGTWVATGHFDIPAERSLNVKFPDIQTTKLKDVVGAWKGH